MLLSYMHVWTRFYLHDRLRGACEEETSCICIFDLQKVVMHMRFGRLILLARLHYTPGCIMETRP